MIKEKSCGAVVYQIKEGIYYFLIEKMQKGHFSIPKGHVEENESESETALREIYEETNLNVQLNTSFREVITYSPKENHLKDVVFFIGQVIDGVLKNQESEVKELYFLPFDEAYKILTFSSDKKILLKAYLFLMTKYGKKIIIIGCPGSGKSYLSKFIQQTTHLPLYHLDLLYWYGNWQHILNEDFIKKQEEIMEKDQWIIDGHFHETLENRIRNADMVIYFKLRPTTCQKGVQYRIENQMLREDMPSSCVETTFDLKFKECIRHFHERKDPDIQNYLKKYSKNVLTIKSKKQIEDIKRILIQQNQKNCQYSS